MTNLSIWRRRYSQALAVCIMAGLLFVMFQSMTGGVPEFGNNFWQREALIQLFTRVRYKLKDHLFAGTVVGPDGWLEYTGTQNLDDYQNSLQFSPVNIQEKLQRLYTELQARNITLLVVIAPNKATIYPQSVPPQIPKLNQRSRLDLLAASLKASGPPVLVDLRPALMAASKKYEETLYYKTDTHWNPLGAYVGYTEIMKVLSKTYPGLTPYPFNAFRTQTEKKYQTMDIAQMMGAPFILEHPLILTPRNVPEVEWVTLNHDRTFPSRISSTSDTHLPKLLLYRDSFSSALIPFLAPHFRQATYVDSFSSYSDLNSLKLVDQLHPDIVIIEIAERFMGSLDPFLTRYLLEDSIEQPATK